MKDIEEKGLRKLVETTSEVFKGTNELNNDDDLIEEFKKLDKYTEPISVARFENDNYVKKQKFKNLEDLEKRLNKRIYGLDCSSIKDTLRYDWSVLFSISHTKIGFKGERDINDLRTKSLITALYYIREEDVNLDLLKENILNKLSNESNVDFNLKFIDNIKNKEKGDDFVKNIIIPYSESFYLKKLASECSRDDSIILDGTILPTGLLKGILELEEERKFYKDENGEWEGIVGEVLRNYLHAHDRVLEKRIPFVSVVKNISSKEFINSIPNGELKIDNDNIFLSNLMVNNKNDELIYTNWFEETDTDSNNFFRKSDHKKMLEGCQNYKHNEDDYTRVFFYVKLPEKGTIARVETLKGLVNKESSEAIQNLVLKEIVESRDVPEPVLQADEEARISKDLRNKLKSQIYKSPVKNYNSERYD